MKTYEHQARNTNIISINLSSFTNLVKSAIRIPLFSYNNGLIYYHGLLWCYGLLWFNKFQEFSIPVRV